MANRESVPLKTTASYLLPKDYTNLSTTVQRLEYCDSELTKLGNVDVRSTGTRDHGLDYDVTSYQMTWTTERQKQFSRYEAQDFPAVMEALSKNIFTQRIWNYSGRIYEESHFKLAAYVKRGMLSTITCLVIGGCFLIASVIVPVIHSRRFSAKPSEAILDFVLLFIASLLFFAAAYLFNIAFIRAMCGEEQSASNPTQNTYGIDVNEKLQYLNQLATK